MPAPANAEDLLDLIQKSGVVDDAKLRSYIQKLTQANGVPKDPAKLAGHLVRDAVLTYFQAEQLLQGKYKRFSIGKYKVLEKLGAGGMAQVFLCEHKLMRRRVAIKVLPTAKADDPSSLDRFYREARAVAAVDHPNIVRAYDIDQDEHLHFLVMEYVDGTNLQDLVKKFGPLDVIRACHYIYGSAIGLQHAHEIGLIHRDIKPGNILIDRAGVVKILDMGLARFFNDDDDVLTKKYDENVLGTADYLAPEQALDSHTVDIRADIYSLGATFYYLLTGSALFPEGSVAQKLIWHQTRQPRGIRSLRSEVPEEIVAIVEKMMAKDPAKRYQSPGEILAALGPWVTTPIPPPADKEIPQVSPAAGGTGSPAGNRPTAGLKANENLRGINLDAPTMIASGSTPSNTQTIPNLPAGPGTSQQATAQLPTNPAVWESLDTDTQTVSQGDTDRSVRDEEPKSRTRKQNGTKPGGAGIILIAGVGILVLSAAIAGIYFAFFSKKRPPEPVVASHTIIVSRAGGENTYTKLGEAINKAVPGDTIVIMEERLSESPLVLAQSRHKDLTIESGLPDNKTVVIEVSGNGAMFRANSIPGLHLKNLEFDGKKLADSKTIPATGILINGICQATLENVTVQNVKVGISLQNAAGEDASRRIVLERVRTHAIDSNNGIGIHVTATNNLSSRWIVIRNSRFEGPCKYGIRFEGETHDVEMSGNRFYNLNSAISLFTGEKPSKDIQIRSNTVYQAQAGIIFEMSKPPQIPNQPPPTTPPGKFDQIAITQNYFTKTGEIATARLDGGDAPIGLSSTDNNAKGPGTGDGKLGLTIAAVSNPEPPASTDNDATFLRFPGGQPEVGPNKAKAGAP